MKNNMFVSLLMILLASACQETKGTLDLRSSSWWAVQLGSVTTINGGTSTGNDLCNGVAVDSDGNVYCAGATESNLGEASGGGYDAFVMKLNSVGHIQWITQLGNVTKATLGNNSADDYCNSVTVDTDGSVYCAGLTKGDLGEDNGGSRDAFIMKLNSEGDLQWVKQLGSTTLGGNTSGNDFCKAVVTDSAHNVYCAGYTTGSLGEATGGGTDAFIFKLNSSGAFVWIKQLGNVTKAGAGSNTADDSCSGISVDSSDNVYCAGSTKSSMGEANAGNRDAFIVKFDSSGTLQWLTQLGTSTIASGGSNAGDDACNSMTIDRSDNLFCAGVTSGSMGEAYGGFTDAFIMKLNSSGTLQWLRQLGNVTKSSSGNNAGTEGCTGVNVDGSGNIFCTGSTNGSMSETNGGGEDAFVVKLNSSGSLSWITQFGAITKSRNGSNAGDDLSMASAVDADGYVFSGGFTDGALGEANGGAQDIFIIKLSSRGNL